MPVLLRRLTAVVIACGVLPVMIPTGAHAESADAGTTADVERALLAATFTCLQESAMVAPGVTQAEVLGDVAADGTAVAPTGTPIDTSDCAARTSADMAEILLDHSGQPVGIDDLVTEFRTTTRADGTGRADTFLVPDAAAPSQTTLAARPGPSTAKRWITAMNRKQDMSGSFFIADYGDPGWFDWSSDQCSAPILGNTIYNFEWPCRRHDFGYRNLKRGENRFPRHNMWGKKNKAVVDRQFRDDLNLHCRLNFSGPARANCRALAATYHYAVSTVPWVGPNTWGMERHTLYPF